MPPRRDAYATAPAFSDFLDELSHLTPWRDRAACKDEDTELFYADRSAREAIAAAKAICARCPVIEQCLDHALTWPEEYGVWGGKSAAERKRLSNHALRVNIA